MSYMTQPHPLFSSADFPECERLLFDIGTPIKGDELFLGNLTSKIPPAVRSLGYLSWNKVEATVSIVFPSTLHALVMPNISNVPKRLDTEPFNALCVRSSFYTESCDFFLIDEDVEQLLRRPIVPDTVAAAIALDGVWMAVTGKLDALKQIALRAASGTLET